MKKANRNTSNKIFCEHIPHLLHKTCNLEVLRCNIDCKTVRIFAYSNTREQSNKRSGTRLKTESERGGGGDAKSTGLRACEARELRARKTLTPLFTDFFTDFENKTDCFRSSCNSNSKVCCTCKDGFFTI